MRGIFLHLYQLISNDSHMVIPHLSVSQILTAVTTRS